MEVFIGIKIFVKYAVEDGCRMKENPDRKKQVSIMKDGVEYENKEQWNT